MDQNQTTQNKNCNNQNNDDDNNNQNNHHNQNNNQSNNADDGTKSVVLGLEKLSKEYDIVLIRYNQAQKDYINYLKTQSTSMSCSKYNSESKELDVGRVLFTKINNAFSGGN